jgi:hypothetical protein
MDVSMPTRRIAELPKAREIPTDDDTLVAFADKELKEFRYAAIGEIRRKHAYSHRNGETEAPTVAGRYWFKGKIDDRQFEYITAVTHRPTDEWMAWDDAEFIQDYVEIRRFVGQWWGPVVTPWEQGE